MENRRKDQKQKPRLGKDEAKFLERRQGSIGEEKSAFLERSAKLLLAAIPRKDAKVVTDMIKRGVDVNKMEPQTFGPPMTPLQLAALSNAKDIAKLLLTHKADPNLRSPRAQSAALLCLNNTPPDWAILNILIQAGAEVNETATSSPSVMSVLVRRYLAREMTLDSFLSVLECATSYGADLVKEDELGFSVEKQSHSFPSWRPAIESGRRNFRQAVLMGFHRRCGDESSLTIHFSKNPIFDPWLMGAVFEFVDGVGSKCKKKIDENIRSHSNGKSNSKQGSSSGGGGRIGGGQAPGARRPTDGWEEEPWNTFPTNHWKD